MHPLCLCVLSPKSRPGEHYCWRQIGAAAFAYEKKEIFSLARIFLSRSDQSLPVNFCMRESMTHYFHTFAEGSKGDL